MWLARYAECIATPLLQSALHSNRTPSPCDEIRNGYFMALGQFYVLIICALAQYVNAKRVIDNENKLKVCRKIFTNELVNLIHLVIKASISSTIGLRELRNSILLMGNINAWFYTAIFSSS